MSPDLENKLISDFPSLFRGANKPLTESLMKFGCEHDDGWFNIIYCMCKSINDHIKNKKELVDYEFTQIKEKFGTLRVYDAGSDDFIEGVIAMAENLSAFTCEVTGNPGKVCRSGNWYKTVSDDQAKKLGYEKI